MSYRFTMAVPESDTEFITWRESQKNISRSIRLVVRNFISQYGEGDVEELLISSMKAGNVLSSGKSTGTKQKSPPIVDKQTVNPINNVTDNEGFAVEPTLDQILAGKKDEGDVDPMSFV